MVNPENHGVLNWLVKCHSYEKYEDQSLLSWGIFTIRVMHVIDLPIPSDFFTLKEVGAKIRDALSGKGHMDNAAQFATKLELKRTDETSGMRNRVLRRLGGQGLRHGGFHRDVQQLRRRLAIASVHLQQPPFGFDCIVTCSAERNDGRDFRVIALEFD